MRPILLRWRGLTVWSYPALFYLGLVVAVVAGNFAAHGARIDAFRTMVASHVLIVVAIVGARFLYVATHWRRHRPGRRPIWSRSRGGAAMYGALPLMLVVSVPLLAALKLPLGAFWDVAAFSILAGMIVTRLGCLMNGCCAGRPSTAWLAVWLPNDRGVRQRRIPTQVLEAAWAAVLLVAAIAARGRLPFPGALFLGVAAGYGGGRLVLESVREAQVEGRRLTINHAISMAVMVSSLGALAACWSK
jgi:phosphatidylglycerol:prolipoprotein diacylglycerol transferase